MSFACAARCHYFFILTLVLLFAVLEPALAAESPAPSWPVRITDALERSVEIPRKPVRIVSLSPVITETLFAIGASPEIRAVTRWCDEPPAARDLPSVGDLSVDLEALLCHEPDLVITMKGLRQGIWQKLEMLGISVLVLDMDDLEQSLASMETLGLATGHGRESLELTEGIRGTLKKVADMLRQSGAVPPRVYLEIWGNPPMTAGGGNFMNRVVELAGGKNVFGSLERSFFTPSMEELLVMDPQVILICYPEETDPIEIRPGFSFTSAVREGRVYRLPVNLFVRSGPRIAQAVLDLYQRLHGSR